MNVPEVRAHRARFGRRRWWPFLVALATVVLAQIVLAPPAAAYPRPGTTERITDGDSGPTDISDDGRFLVLTSRGSTLVPGDTNETADVFVHDRETGTTERVSVASDGTEGNGFSNNGGISDDGRYIAFSSAASNLVPGDTNGAGDVFLHDRETGTTERVSVASDGTEGNGESRFAVISGDGRYVAFDSRAPNLVPGVLKFSGWNCVPGGVEIVHGTLGCRNVFLRDRLTGTTELVSVGLDGSTPGNGESFLPDISAAGRYVMFASQATNLVPGDTNQQIDVFVRDLEGGTTERVSVSSDGTQQNGSSSGNAAISPDGRYVGFHTTSSNLVPGDTNYNCDGPGEALNCFDVFVHDRETGTTERVSVASDGTEGNGWSFFPQFSADGRYVTFWSGASNLVEGDENARFDVFVHDRETGTTERVSVASDGTESPEGGGDGGAIITANGREVFFMSAATNLVPGDTNGNVGVFVRDRGPATGVSAVEVQRAAGEAVVSGWATFSGLTVASAEDSPDDGEDALGAEIMRASVIYRPEQEGLLLRLRLASLPSASQPCINVQDCQLAGTGALPGVLYRFGFGLGGTRYEVRALREAGYTGGMPPLESRFSLHKCTPECAEIGPLYGGIGTTDTDVRVAVPLAALAAEEGAELTDIEMSAGRAASPLTPAEVLDEMALPDAPIPTSRVELGIAPPSAPQAEIDFTTPADLADGRFSATLDVSSFAGAPYRVWARASLGKTRGTPSMEPSR